MRGYLTVRIFGRSYKAHRLAWLYMTGAWPALDVDHKNGVHDDNRWDNLREVTMSVNQQNQRKAQRGNVVGLLGVSAKRKKFSARIHLNGKTILLGVHDTPEMAHAAYLKAKREIRRLHAMSRELNRMRAKLQRRTAGNAQPAPPTITDIKIDYGVADGKAVVQLNAPIALLALTPEQAKAMQGGIQSCLDALAKGIGK